MTDDAAELGRPLEPRVVRAVRSLYAPPGGEGYWAALEARVMARVAASASASARWWQIVGGWGRIGVVAAAAALVAAVVGTLLVRAHLAEQRTAFESATHPAVAESVAVPAGALSERDGPDQRGATFRDVISR